VSRPTNSLPFLGVVFNAHIPLKPLISLQLLLAFMPPRQARPGCADSMHAALRDR